MRVDFLASYREVSKLVTPERSSPEAVGEKFELPSEAPIHIAAENQSLGPVVRAPREPSFAGLIAYPDVETPPLMTGEVEAEPPVDVPTEVVKKPSIIDVRRIDSEAMAGLSRPDRIHAVHQLVEQAGDKHGVDPLLGLAVVAAESSFDPHAVSKDGHASKGLFQLLDRTGKGLKETILPEEDEYNPFNPQMNVELGVGYLKRLHEIFKTSTDLDGRLSTVGAENSASLEKFAIAGFNAGEGRVAAAQERANQAGKDPAKYEHVAPYLPESTQRYVQRVLGLKEEFETGSVGRNGESL